MNATPSSPPGLPRTSRQATRIGWGLTGLGSLFLLFDAVMKLAQAPEAVTTTVELGYSADVVVALGIVEVVCLLVYLWPRTSVLGAVLWTGYLGGAIATHVRVGNPLFSHVLFPIYVAALLWGGLWLRDELLRRVLPVRAGSR